MNTELFIKKLQERIDAKLLFGETVVNARQLVGGLLEDPEIICTAGLQSEQPTVTASTGTVVFANQAESVATASLAPAVPAEPFIPPVAPRPLAPVVPFDPPERKGRVLNPELAPTFAQEDHDPTKYKKTPPVGFSITGGPNPIQ